MAQARDSKGHFVGGKSKAKAKKPCKNCHFMGDASGLVDQDTLCPVCKGSGRV